jgi:hypothetical protein
MRNGRTRPQLAVRERHLVDPRPVRVERGRRLRRRAPLAVAAATVLLDAPRAHDAHRVRREQERRHRAGEGVARERLDGARVRGERRDAAERLARRQWG